jgi:hypothetical protein
MTDYGRSLLSVALREPQALPRWDIARWELLIRQARRANLVGRLAALLEDRGLLHEIHAAPRAHLEAARTVSLAQEEAVRREVMHICLALRRAGTEGILLKGAAYVFAALPAARGRQFSDIDILVPRAALGEVEAALMLKGWATTHHHPYDQRYYRQWIHELPPLQHATRLTVVDVHHAILPPTARLKPDSRKLWAASRPIAGTDPLRLLAPADMVLHSAAHLFCNEEFSNGLRDLADLDSLLRHFGQQPEFWEGLVGRAEELDLGRPLYYALRYLKRVLATSVPAQVLRRAEAACPPAPLQLLMDAFFLRVLQPDHPSTADALTRLAKRALYVRAHWLRMPPLLLAYHLTAKALRPDEPAPARMV